MLKILLFIDSLGSGGAQRQMAGLAKLLQDKGYQIKVIYYHPIYFYKDYLDEYHVPNEYVTGSEDKIKRIFMIARVIKKTHPAVVISYLDAPNMIACILKALGMKFKLITSERNTTQEINFNERAKFFLLRWADIIVPNSYTQERLIKKKFYFLSSKTTTITNYVDTNHFVPSNREKHDKPRILIVARISIQKNVLPFLQAVHAVKNEGFSFSVDWYGRADDDIFQHCKAYIDSHQLGDVFSFHKPVYDIIHEYQQSDIFCLPSLFEGFPNVICEAMSCGLPILCSDVSDHSWLVEKGKNGLLFDPKDVKDMANKMKAILTLSEEERKNMGSRSRKLAVEKLSKESFTNKYLDIIQQL